MLCIVTDRDTRDVLEIYLESEVVTAVHYSCITVTAHNYVYTHAYMYVRACVHARKQKLCSTAVSVADYVRPCR